MTGAVLKPIEASVLIDAGVGADVVPFHEVPAYLDRLLTALDRLQTARPDDWRDLTIPVELGGDTLAIPAIEALPIAIAVLHAIRAPAVARALLHEPTKP